MFKKNIFFLSILSCFLLPSTALAQEEIWRAQVTAVIGKELVEVPFTNITSTVQALQAELRSGPRKGEVVTFTNDHLALAAGDRFFIGATEEEGEYRYRVVERDRRPVLLAFIALFAAAIIIFGKRQGIRSLLSLAGSIAMIAYVLLPSLARGANPLVVSTAIATGILFVAIYFTHGFRRESTAAFLGTVLGVLCTGLLAFLAVSLCRFTGLGSDEATYLNIQSDVALNFGGLLLGGIIIGVLGVLDDIAVTQVSVVRELYSSAPHLTKRQLYQKALRVGQEHVGALVNTLALAYTGASLPLLLLLSRSEYPTQVLLSQELFSVEVIRTIVGSIGLVLTVPITTLLAVYMLKHYRGREHSHFGHAH